MRYSDDYFDGQETMSSGRRRSSGNTSESRRSRAAAAHDGSRAHVSSSASRGRGGNDSESGRSISRSAADGGRDASRTTMRSRQTRATEDGRVRTSTIEGRRVRSSSDETRFRQTEMGRSQASHSQAGAHSSRAHQASASRSHYSREEEELLRSGRSGRSAHNTSRMSAVQKKKRAEKLKKQKKKRRNMVIILAIEAVVLAVAVFAVVVVSKYNLIQKPSWGKISILHNEEIDQQVLEQMEEGYTDIMLFGTDARITEGNTGNLESGSGADVNILVHINNATGEIRMVSFYRDLYLNYDGGYHKLTDIYRSYGAAGALNAINRNFDLNVKMFATSSWAGAAWIIHSIGGTEVDVTPNLLGYLNSYITETVNETGIGSQHLTSSGYQHLDGVQTVAYCRIRHINVDGYDYGDFGRTERQREVITQLFSKVKQLDLGQINALIDIALPQVYTNVTLTDVLGLAANINRYSMADSIGFPYDKAAPTILNSKGQNVDAVLAIDLASNVLRLHQDLYGTDDGYQISDTVQNIAYDTFNKWGY